jgi:5-methylcytosine-specific restriction endonuclease McrA
MGLTHHNRRWPAIRLAAKRRDDWQCRECGERGRLEVHHRIPARQAPDKAFDLGNCITLCRSCHLAAHGQNPNPQRLAWAELLKETAPC